MATGAGKNESRVAKERTRLYQARAEFHDGIVRRRRHDNLVAGVAGGAIILAVIGGQVAYYALGPGRAAPEPISTPIPTTPIPTAPPLTTPLPTPPPTP
ncbi:dioxygenase [Microbacterium sp.]|uniref:dioxygenase n=1 Tax=Microbacterium sp. TaxID=51671 RepID=UPI0026006C63|nr:dioxygenase [Microbacterium sp.]